MAEKLYLPRTLFKNTFGFGLDVGGSCAKICYTEEDGENLCIKFAKFSSLELTEALVFLKGVVKDKLAEGSEVCVCGVGCNEHATEIEKTLNIKLKIVSEVDTMVESFLFLNRTLTWDKFVYPASGKAMARGKKLAQDMGILVRSLTLPEKCIRDIAYFEEVDPETNQLPDRPPADETLKYPLMLFMMGSTAGFVQVNEDGRYCPINFSPVGGKAFLGLGSLITDAKTFDDLHKLAESGDSSKVDQRTFDVSGDESVYGVLVAMDLKVFSFNQLIGRSKEDFKQEDLAAALLENIIQIVCSDAYRWATIRGIKQVFFVSGFTSPHIREKASTKFSMNDYAHTTDATCDHWFVRNSAHLSALGTLMKNLELK